MREIKFRAWDKKYKQMASFEKMEASKIFALDSGLEHPEQFIVLPRHENVVLMQWTGLHDKNGKEIYEGDILFYKTQKNEYRPVVVFDAERGAYEHSPHLPFTTYFDVGEVIGNIYENPGLLT